MNDNKTYTNENEIKNIVNICLNKEDDVGWLALVESGRNLFDSANNPEELVISSVVVREYLKTDLVCFLYSKNKCNIEKTVIEYNNLIDSSQIKIEQIKKKIQDDFTKELSRSE
jgi:hypothetical protein